MIELIPSVKLGTYRTQDTNASSLDEDFARVREKVLQRDAWTCQGCGMRTRASRNQLSGGFHVHHINDDHGDNDLDNLVTLCPFCHDVFHIGNAGARKAATAVWLPGITQAQINIVCHVLFILMHHGQEDDDKESTEAAERACKAYESLYAPEYIEALHEHLGISELSLIGETLAYLGHHHPETYEKRKHFLYGLRLIPNYEHYQDTVKTIALSSPNMALISASKLPDLWKQYKAE